MEWQGKRMRILSIERMFIFAVHDKDKRVFSKYIRLARAAQIIGYFIDWFVYVFK
jgi:hypothetical protein